MFPVLAAALVSLFAASLALFLQGLFARRAARRDALRQRIAEAAEQAGAPVSLDQARRALGLEDPRADAFILRLVDDRTLFLAVDERQGRLCLHGPAQRPSLPPSPAGRRRRA